LKKPGKYKIAILIPYYNAQDYLPPLIAEIVSLHPEIPIVLVDDGSTDQTADLLARAGFQHLHPVHHSSNQGKGASLKTGIRYISEYFPGHAIITMDADGQHPARRLQDFIDHHVSCPEALIIGKRRFHPSLMPLARIISNSLSSKLLGWKLKQKIEDSQCGFRLIPPVLHLTGLQCKETGFQFETEFLLKAAQAGYPLKFTPIETIYNGSPSAIKKTNDILTFIRLYFNV